MITKIGVIYQDRNSIGFLRGLRDRLECRAEFVEPPARIGKPRVLPRRRARLAWTYFRKQGVDLVVRFTDADAARWQAVRRDELKVVPDEAASIWLCGVAVNNPEEWMCRDPGYLAQVLDIPPAELQNQPKRTGIVKRAIGRKARREIQNQSDVVAQLVRDAPDRIFRRWLEDDALRTFYTDCRDAAKNADCETPNELEAGEDD